MLFKPTVYRHVLHASHQSGDVAAAHEQAQCTNVSICTNCLRIASGTLGEALSVPRPSARKPKAANRSAELGLRRTMPWRAKRQYLFEVRVACSGRMFDVLESA